MKNSLFKKLTVLAVIFTLAGSLLFFVRGAWIFGAGIWVGAAWIYLNTFFLFKLFQISFEPRVRMNDRILLFSILKFPVLYIAGFFILRTRVFPIYSILTGLTLFIAAFVVAWVRFSTVNGKLPEKITS